MRSSAGVWLAAAFLGGRCAFSAAYVERIDSRAVFEALSVEETFRSDLLRVGKYLAPAREDPELLQTVFQDVHLYPRHLEFMANEFPQHFPSLAPQEYLLLVQRRETRLYWAGSLYEIAPGRGDCRFGITMFTEQGNPAELPTEEEVASLLRTLSERFTLAPLCYVPATEEAQEQARTWTDPPFDIYFLEPAPEVSYEAYTEGTACGRVRLLSAGEAERASAEGLLSWQEIAVVRSVPAFLESPVAAVVTGERQGELSHLNVRAARRGTPNVYIRGAHEVFRPYEGQLVRVTFRVTHYEAIEPISEQQAQQCWDDNRITLPPPPACDLTWSELVSLEAMEQDRVLLRSRYGAKAANLALLQHCLPAQRRLPGFAIPFRFYREFLTYNTIVDRRTTPPHTLTLSEYINELLSDPRFRTDPQYRSDLLAGLRETMRRRSAVDPDLVVRLVRKIEEVFGSRQVMVRFRSSSNAEDSLRFNGAGLYDSTSACALDSTDGDSEGPSRCDQYQAEERQIGRALRKVWASLWNFRAYEEREYFGIPHEQTAMAIVVTPAFPREAANGVAFTGNPLDPRDKRYLVNVQQGDRSVVNPDPHEVPEKDILELRDGQVVSIIRARPSSVVPPGTYVLTDDQLKELGAVLAGVAECFPLETGSFSPDRVILDIEFKFTGAGELVLKQARPFLITAEPVAGPTFSLSIPEGAAFEGVHLYGRSLDTEERLLSKGRFRPGRYEIPATGAPSSADLIEYLAVGSPQALAEPEGPGAFQIERRADGTYRAVYRQNFTVQGKRYQLLIDRLQFADAPGKRTIFFDDSYLSLTGDFLPGLYMYAAPADSPDDVSERVFFAGSGYPALPLYRVTIEGAGERIELLYRLLRLLEPTASGPANLVRASVKLQEGTHLVTDYWHLVYSARIHNTQQKFRIILDPPLGQVAVIDIAEPFEDIIPPQVVMLTAGRQVLRTMTVETYREDGPFLRGDANSDGRRTVSDALYILRYLFGAYREVPCADAADVDDSGGISLSDSFLLLRYLFTSGPPPSEPRRLCGPDPTPQDDLDCRTYRPCGFQ